MSIFAEPFNRGSRTIFRRRKQCIHEWSSPRLGSRHGSRSGLVTSSQYAAESKVGQRVTFRGSRTDTGTKLGGVSENLRCAAPFAVFENSTR